MKEKLFSLSKDNGDFIIEYTNGTGNGGQNRNKREMACRIHHPKSGAVAFCQEERSQKANREKAFKRLCESQIFQLWLKKEIFEYSGKINDIENKVEEALKPENIKIEVHDEKGKWIPEN
jgi:protein subunit release factor A